MKFTGVEGSMYSFNFIFCFFQIVQACTRLDRGAIEELSWNFMKIFIPHIGGKGGRALGEMLRVAIYSATQDPTSRK
ncbi:MAG: hypothetical protein ACTSUE_03330 [Promethearchaeota archaeon]